jgi:hypothetical protein
LLKHSAAKIISHQHLEKWRRRSSGGFLLPLPRWTEGMEDVIEPYVWRSTEAPQVVAPCSRSCNRQVNDYVDYVRLHRQRLCRNVNPASSLRGLVNRFFHLVDDLG